MDMNAVVVSEDALLNEQFTRFTDRWDKTSRRISQETGISVLTNVSEFITKIPKGYSFHSGWSGLVDLTLEGRALADSTMAQLFDSLAAQQLLSQIRILQLKNNKIHHLAIISLLNGKYHSSHTYIHIHTFIHIHPYTHYHTLCTRPIPSGKPGSYRLLL